MEPLFFFQYVPPTSSEPPSSVLAPFVATPFAPSSVLVTSSKALVTRSDALVPSSVLAPRLAFRPSFQLPAKS